MSSHGVTADWEESWEEDEAVPEVPPQNQIPSTQQMSSLSFGPPSVPLYFNRYSGRIPSTTMPVQISSGVFRCVNHDQLDGRQGHGKGQPISSTWNPAMEHEAQEIVNGLFLGPGTCAGPDKLLELQRTGITHILMVRDLLLDKGLDCHHVHHSIIYLTFDISDNMDANIIQHFRPAVEYIEYVLKNSGKVLVHGARGVSRSACFVIAFVMSHYGVTYREAFNFVSNHRPFINLNQNFVNQLLAYEPIALANRTILSPVLPDMEMDNLTPDSVKREAEDETENVIKYRAWE